jgi:phospholipid/cholesterol/gamma-HCH transport system substrate-binding protein
VRIRLRREGRWLLVIGAIVLLAVACAIYLLSNERLASPFSSAYDIKAEFANVGAVAPGLGEAVNVAGVRVGQVSDVELRNGRGLLTLRIDPSKMSRLYPGTRATLVPNTPLKDMQVDLAPGEPTGRPLPSGSTIPLADTQSTVDADEFTHALDADTRDYLQALITDVGVGLHGRGKDLRGLLRSLGPTARQVRRITSLLASRRHELPGLVHNLSLLSTAAGSREADVTRVVQAGNATLGALASQDGALRSALTQLPGTLSAARTTLYHAAPFARSLRRTLTAVEPAVPRLKRTLQSTPEAIRGLLGLPIGPLKRFTTAVGPLGAQVRPAARDLGLENPSLVTAFAMINKTTNILAYDPGHGGKSYLFWLAWFAHNADSMISTEDAHGAVWRGLGLISCDTFGQNPQQLTGQPFALLIKSTSGCP